MKENSCMSPSSLDIWNLPPACAVAVNIFNIFYVKLPPTFLLIVCVYVCFCTLVCVCVCVCVCECACARMHLTQTPECIRIKQLADCDHPAQKVAEE